MRTTQLRGTVGRAARLARAAAVAAVVAGVSMTWVTPAAPAASAVPPVRHVFVIVLENEGYAATFGNPSADPYLATTLPSQGALLTNYYGIGHESNDNYLAMVSGQAPNPQTQADCQDYTDFVATGATVPPGQAVGSGCVYPSSVSTIGNQLTTAGLSWKGYMQDMGNIPTREPSTCAHPALNSQDKTQSATAGDGYATRHNPFVYFHSIIDNPAYCSAHVVPLGATNASTGLAHDLASARTTPNLSFVVPNLCLDGHDYPCTNQTAPSTSALGDIDTFLQTWVPLITRSAAYRTNGLLVIAFDEAAGPPNGDSSACCGELPGPNSPLPGITGMGGGRTGAVVLSPFIKPGTVVTTGYNHYGLLGSLESLFGLPRLGEAQTAPATFGADVFTRPAR
jgi:phosphatidylinositol-3-phosphatase